MIWHLCIKPLYIKVFSLKGMKIPLTSGLCMPPRPLLHIPTTLHGAPPFQTLELPMQIVKINCVIILWMFLCMLKLLLMHVHISQLQ